MEKGARIEDFRLDNVRARIAKVGDLWKPLLASRGRVDLGRVCGERVNVADFDFDLPESLIAQEPSSAGAARG